MSQPKHIGQKGEGGSESNDTLLVFPTAFPIKVMGRMKSQDASPAKADFAQTVAAIVLKHAPDFDIATLEMRPSKNGNFISVTATINATSKPQLDDIYRELTAHPAVLMAL
jgi:putative lipoic acid-binding regulatory protein